LPIEVPVVTPRMIMTIEGGMTVPSEPAHPSRLHERPFL
jgi:hypothetical protein